MNSWCVVFLPVVEDTDVAHVTVARPHRALAVERDAMWCFDWALFKGMDLKVAWTVSFHMLYGESARLRQVMEPWAVIVREVIRPVALWHGPPPPPRRPPRGPAEPRERRPALADTARPDRPDSDGGAAQPRRAGRHFGGGHGDGEVAGRDGDDGEEPPDDVAWG